MAFTDKFDPEDYYMTEEGYIVFTEKYHLKRGYCCQSGCRHCPWKTAAGGSGSRQGKARSGSKQ